MLRQNFTSYENVSTLKYMGKSNINEFWIYLLLNEFNTISSLVLEQKKFVSQGPKFEKNIVSTLREEILLSQ